MRLAGLQNSSRVSGGAPGGRGLLVAPLGAQENSARTTYEYLDLFGDIFERVRSTYLEDVDEKGALWIQKLVVALHDLEHTQTDVRFFEDDDEAFFQATLVQFGALSSGRSASGLPRP